MDHAELAPIAEMLLSGYLSAADYSQDFRDSWGHPPTSVAKSHHVRSVVQALVLGADGFVLASAYSELGRVQLTAPSGRVYLLRSDRALKVEQATTMAQHLFSPVAYTASPVVGLVYRFGPDGLDLSVAGMQRRGRSRKLYISNAPTFVGAWPYMAATDGRGFDQQESSDPFGEIGEIDLDEGGELP